MIKEVLLQEEGSDKGSATSKLSLSTLHKLLEPGVVARMLVPKVSSVPQ